MFAFLCRTPLVFLVLDAATVAAELAPKPINAPGAAELSEPLGRKWPSSVTLMTYLRYGRAETLPWSDASALLAAPRAQASRKKNEIQNLESTKRRISSSCDKERDSIE